MKLDTFKSILMVKGGGSRQDKEGVRKEEVPRGQNKEGIRKEEVPR